MRILFFLTVFYGALIFYGVSASHARGGACSDPQCTEKEIAADVEGEIPSEEDVITQIQNLLATIESKISKEKLHGIIQNAAEKNPQVAELLALLQQYGILTDIEISTEHSEAPAKESI
jgi:hypothetical protein